MNGRARSDVLKSSDDEELLQAARNAAAAAYAPYSGFRVGAAVRGDHGIYAGANIENASYNLGLCAERAAMAAAIAAGEKTIRAIAISCIDAPAKQDITLKMPCGACRQWMVELAPNAKVLVDGVSQVFAVGDLLPHAFALPAKKSASKP